MRRARLPLSPLRLRVFLALVLALGYGALGLSAAWHAPHFSQKLESIGSDRHADHEAVTGSDCALCTVKTAPQLGPSRPETSTRATQASSLLAAPPAAVLTAAALEARPRAPPVFS